MKDIDLEFITFDSKGKPIKEKRRIYAKDVEAEGKRVNVRLGIQRVTPPSELPNPKAKKFKREKK